jgi:very-short-patch-repair endonuclease
MDPNLLNTLTARLEASRQELLDLGLRNPLLNFRLSKAQGVAVVREESAQILDILVKQGKTMYFSAAPEPAKKKERSQAKAEELFPATTGALPSLESYFSEHPPVELTEVEQQALLIDNKLQTAEPLARLETRLLNTYYTSRTSLEETGVNILYLALGQLSWYEAESSTEPRKAPLILVPVVLERGTVAERFKLTHSGAEVEGNLSLQARLKADFGIALPLPELESQPLVDYFEAVKAALAGRDRWTVEPDAIVLSFFSFSKLMLYRDLDPATWPVTAAGMSSLVEHPAIGSLLGTETGFTDALPSVGEHAFLDTESSAAELHQVLDADSSQLLALLAVQEGRNLVIQGPPGTGKSQTIANLLAEAIGAGKKVLFVAEKMAALEVVKRRLDALGLGAACLELHSNKANKKSLHEELRHTLALGRPATPLALEEQIVQLPPLRTQLNDYSLAVNSPLGRSRRTMQQIAGALLVLGEEVGGQQLPRPPFPNLANWTDADATRTEALAARMQATLQKIGPPPQLLFWGTDLTILLPIDQEQLAAKLQAAQVAVRELASTGEALAGLLESPPPLDRAAATVLKPLAQRAYQEALAAHESGVMAAVELLQTEATALANLLQQPPPADQSAAETLAALAQHRHGEALVAHSGRAATAIEAVQAAAVTLAALLRLPPPIDRAAAEALVPVAEHAALAPPLPGVAVADAFWAQPNSPLPAAQQASVALNDLHQRYDSVLLPEAWGQNLAAERAVLVTTGTKWWRFLSGAYRRTRRQLQQLWRGPLPSDPSELVVIIDALHEAARHAQTLREVSSLAGRLFGAAWRAEASDWPTLVKVADYLSRTHQLLAQQRLPVAILSHLAANPSAAAVAAPSASLVAALAQHAQAMQEAQNAIRPGNSQRVALPQQLANEPWPAQASAVAAWVASTPQAPDVAARLAAWKAAFDTYTTAKQKVETAVPARGPASVFGLGSDWQSQPFARQLLTLTAWVAATPQPQAITQALRAVEEALFAQLATGQALREALALDEARRFGAAGPFVTQPFADQSVLLAAWLGDLPALQFAIEWNNLAAVVRTECRPELLPLAETWPGAARYLVAAVRQTWLEYLQRLAYTQFPALTQFERAGHEDAAAQFRVADRASLVHNRARAMTRHFEGLPNALSPLAGGQMGIIKNEFAKKRGHMPIRKLILEAGRVVQAIKPVFMMSPLSVASFLPPGAVEFDLIVFDEASQVKPVDALGAVARGKKLVVVGDSKQLPPTSFFDSLTGGGEDTDEENVTADIQSILELCKARQMPERMLRWHYRSLHQSLIAASNHLFYEDKLVIFPSPGGKGQLGLVYHYLPTTYYERGITRTNPQEAAAVAAAVLHHARTTPKLTLGVVAFSTVQRQAIQDALEIGRRQHPETEAFFAAHRHEPFFIKNLENVQGDERDVILISIGYGRTKDGYLSMSFGPLSGEGGERRLNVLITRAKQRCEVFTNLTADDLDVSRVKHAKGGVAALKTFLNFAQYGRLNQNEETGREMESPFEEAVHRALTARGYTVRPQIGSQGFYIDLAVVDPDQPGRYVLGIECDGAMYHSARSARDRDRLRQQVLEAVGWRLHRIWSTDWFRDPARETERVIAAIEEARRLATLDEPDEQEEAVVEAVPVGLEREELVETAGPAASRYQLAKLPDTIQQQELHLHPVGLLARWVAEVVRVEAPVHPDEVARRLGQASGAAQLGRRMRASVEAAIKLAVKLETVRQQDGFLWNAVTADTDVPLPRDRSTLPTASRKLALVAPQELAQAVLQVVRESFAIEREAVASPAAKLFGFSRLVGEEPRLLFETAIDQLIRTKQLADANGILRPVETE